MKKRTVIATLCLCSCVALLACGSTSETASNAGGAASSAAAAAADSAAPAADSAVDVEDADLSDDAELVDSEEEGLELVDDTESYEEPVSEKLVQTQMENPFGEDVDVSIWDGIETVPDTDGTSRSTMSSYANNLTIEHELLKDSGDAETILKNFIKSEATRNMSYTQIQTESTRKKDDQAWTMLSFKGKGSTPYAELVSVQKLDDETALKTTVNYYLGVDIYGVDYTPDQKYLTMVMDEFGISKTEGDEIALTEADTKPDVVLHEYTFEDSNVGTKSFLVWDEEPYVMTADDEASYYDDFDFDFTDSGAESLAEDVDGEDGELAFNDVTLTESDFDEVDYTESDIEYAESDIEAGETDSYAEEFYDDEFLDDGTEASDFVAYCSTAAEGVFVNAEMYRKSEDGVAEAMMEEYIDNLAYMGASELKRSEVKTSDHAAWITVKYGDEADEAYANLTLIRAIVTDDNTYATFDIYVPSDANPERLAEYLNAYGLTEEEATIEVEQKLYDAYGEEGLDSDVETMEDDASLFTEDDEEEEAVG